jgi:ribosomal protein S27AE
MRQIHYKIISQAEPMLMPDGNPYLNTERCEEVLERTSLDARYLGLVLPFIDRRNPEPTIFLDDTEASDALITANTFTEEGKVKLYCAAVPEIEKPRLRLFPPDILQRYHIEIFCEKSTQNHILMPLGERFGSNIVTAVGEFSHTRCLELIERARASGRPVRILYISDFDPAGQSMPVSVARKIEFEIRTKAPDLDVQVRCVALTYEQCQRYRLPRTPIKDGEKRAAGFEARFGEGATELDALEALHPGELERLLEEEIGRYYDDDLDDRIAAVAAEMQSELDRITRSVHRRYAKELAALAKERDVHEKALAKFANKVNKTLNEMRADLEAEAPDPNDADWPEPKEGDEDEAPLYDSTRSYVEQIDFYKKHQGKTIEERKPRKALVPQKHKCVRCGETFMAVRPNAERCEKCKKEHRAELEVKRRAAR